MISSLLIANRGEIACRIIKTCKRLGIKTVALASEADRSSLHASLADEVVYLPGAEPRRSYLLGDLIIEGAIRGKAEAIHPGYGFLAENADFAEAVIKAGLTWVGPSPESMRASGSKTNAKALATKASVPIPPWTLLTEGSEKSAKNFCVEHGFPIMIKAEAGGGGRGMRRVDNEAALPKAIESASREAKAAFGNGDLFLEKLIENPRHVEVQIFGDNFGSVIALGDRDCSLQRNHQKIVEEAPAPNIPDKIRKEILASAVRLGKACGYVNAGTCEFLFDGSNFYFLEINSRLQVEHPVTESIYDVDLVELQIRVASGEKLPSLSDKHKGHAIEARICAEVPEQGFIASTGVIHDVVIPSSSSHSRIRIDSGVVQGSRVTQYYDSLIAKVISIGETRAKAINGLKEVLSGARFLGIKTNIPFLIRAIHSKEFAEVCHHVSFANTLIEKDMANATHAKRSAAAAAYIAENSSCDSSFRLGGVSLKKSYSVDVEKVSVFETEPNVFEVAIDDSSTTSTLKLVSRTGNEVAIRSEAGEISFFPLTLGHGTWVSSALGTFFVKRFVASPSKGKGEGLAADGAVKSTLPGKVVSVLASVGESVEEGAPLFVVESMKMEHIIRAPRGGVVGSIGVKEGAFIDGSTVLLSLDLLSLADS